MTQESQAFSLWEQAVSELKISEETLRAMDENVPEEPEDILAWSKKRMALKFNQDTLIERVKVLEQNLKALEVRSSEREAAQTVLNSLTDAATQDQSNQEEMKPVHDEEDIIKVQDSLHRQIIKLVHALKKGPETSLSLDEKILWYKNINTSAALILSDAIKPRKADMTLLTSVVQKKSMRELTPLMQERYGPAGAAREAWLHEQKKEEPQVVEESFEDYKGDTSLEDITTYSEVSEESEFSDARAC